MRCSQSFPIGVLGEAFALGDFFQRLQAAPRRLLLSDYDSTLAPLRLDPAQALPNPGEAGSEAVTAYLGDDRTDEDAFRGIKGRGLAVLVRPGYRPTLADICIRHLNELLDFLANWCAACGEVRP